MPTISSTLQAWSCCLLLLSPSSQYNYFLKTAVAFLPSSIPQHKTPIAPSFAKPMFFGLPMYHHPHITLSYPPATTPHFATTSDNGDDYHHDDHHDDDNNHEEDTTTLLLEAKLHVLEDVVVKLNGTKFQDEEEIKQLQSKLGHLEDALALQNDEFEATLKRSTQQLENELTVRFDQERVQLKNKHEEELQELKDTLERQVQIEQEELEQRLRNESKEWKMQQELEWEEKLEIATASVQAGEAREQAMQLKLEDLEVRYQQEAANYKTEFDQLRKEWKVENRRLETEVTRLQGELHDAKQKRDSESTKLIDQLGSRSRHLETELKRTKEQAQIARVKLATQQQMAQVEWDEQREKERKFYTEAMRLLQKENAMLRQKQGFWARLFRFVGRKPSLKKPMLDRSSTSSKK